MSHRHEKLGEGGFFRAAGRASDSRFLFGPGRQTAATASAVSGVLTANAVDVFHPDVEYLGLTHLRSFPFDKIKIDGSFIKDAVERPESAAIVRAIAHLGKRLGVATVAEGVETEDHLNRALKNGCSEIQGYFYGRPEPSAKDAAAVAELNKITSKVTAA